MDVKTLQSLEWAAAAEFYNEAPDGQYDEEAYIACKLMPHFVSLLVEHRRRESDPSADPVFAWEWGIIMDKLEAM